jgi:uncharacterized protein (TIGR02266 family)
MDADDSADGRGRRREERIGVVLQLAYRSASHLLVSYCTNLSRGGIFVPTRQPMPAGSRIALSITVPGDSAPIELMAEVRWVRQFDAVEGPAGMGLAFEDVDEHLGERVDRIVAEFVPLVVTLCSDNPAASGHVGAIVRTVVSCETREYSIAGAMAALDALAAADLVIIEVGSDPGPALTLLKTISGVERPPPRVGICDARGDVLGRIVSSGARSIGTPVDAAEIRECVLDSLAQVEARRRGT